MMINREGDPGGGDPFSPAAFAAIAITICFATILILAAITLVRL